MRQVRDLTRISAPPVRFSCDRVGPAHKVSLREASDTRRDGSLADAQRKAVQAVNRTASQAKASFIRIQSCDGLKPALFRFICPKAPVCAWHQTRLLPMLNDESIADSIEAARAIP